MLNNKIQKIMKAIFSVETVNVSEFENAKCASKRVIRSVQKLPLKNIIKVIDAKVRKAGTGKSAQVGSLTLVEALRACGYSTFSTSLLTFIDKERTKLVALYEEKKAKDESVLGKLVKECYALIEGENCSGDSVLEDKVAETYKHLANEEAKAVAKAKKREEARNEEIEELKAYFVSVGQSEEAALELAQKCRIIKANIKDGKALWSEIDLYSSWAFTKASVLAKWEEEKAAIEAQEKAAKEAKREERKAKKEAANQAKANKKAEAYAMAKNSLVAILGRELTAEEETRLAANIA